MIVFSICLLVPPIAFEKSVGLALVGINLNYGVENVSNSKN